MFRYPFLDFDALNSEINQNKIESHSKLRYIHEHLGGSFYDPEKRIMTGARVAVVSIGGFPVELDQNGLKLMGAPISTEHVEGQLLETALCDMDDPDHETRNLLFPSAKASAVILTGSLKDIMKLIALKEAGGKEAEFVSALTLIQDVVGCAFPSLFYK